MRQRGALIALLALVFSQLTPAVATRLDNAIACIFQQVSKYASQSNSSATTLNPQLNTAEEASLNGCLSGLKNGGASGGSSAGSGSGTSGSSAGSGSGTSGSGSATETGSTGVSGYSDASINALSNPCASTDPIPDYTGGGTYVCIPESTAIDGKPGQYDIACPEGGVFNQTELAWRCSGSSPPEYASAYLQCLATGMGFLASCAYGDQIMASMLRGSTSVQKVTSGANIVTTALGLIIKGQSPSLNDVAPSVCASWTIANPTGLANAEQAEIDFGCEVVDLFFHQSSLSPSAPSPAQVAAAEAIPPIAGASAVYDVRFVSHSALSAGTQVTVNLDNTTLPTTVAAPASPTTYPFPYRVIADGTSSTPSSVSMTSGSAVLTLADSISANSTTTILIAGVSNPSSGIYPVQISIGSTIFTGSYTIGGALCTGDGGYAIETEQGKSGSGNLSVKGIDVALLAGTALCPSLVGAQLDLYVGYVADGTFALNGNVTVDGAIINQLIGLVGDVKDLADIVHGTKLSPVGASPTFDFFGELTAKGSAQFGLSGSGVAAQGFSLSGIAPLTLLPNFVSPPEPPTCVLSCGALNATTGTVAGGLGIDLGVQGTLGLPAGNDIFAGPSWDQSILSYESSSNNSANYEETCGSLLGNAGIEIGGQPIIQASPTLLGPYQAVLSGSPTTGCPANVAVSVPSQLGGGISTQGTIGISVTDSKGNGVPDAPVDVALNSGGQPAAYFAGQTLELGLITGSEATGNSGQAAVTITATPDGGSETVDVTVPGVVPQQSSFDVASSCPPGTNYIPTSSMCSGSIPLGGPQ